MKKESDFSWEKIGAFVGALLLVFIGVVTLSSGIGLCFSHKAFNGVCTALCSLLAFNGAVQLYKWYEEYSNKRRNDDK